MFKILLEHDAPLVIHTGGNDDTYNNPSLVLDIAKRYKALKIVIAHYFQPRLKNAYQQLKDYPNVVFDTSALADKDSLMITGEKTTSDIILKTLKMDDSRIIFGSDYQACLIADHKALITSLTITEAQKEKIYSSNAIKHYKLPISK